MKKIFVVFATWLFVSPCFGQSEEAQQLLLNWEKLSQFKKILNDMYKGYKVLYKGYTTIKDISQGNFDLHRNFLDGLLQVSPAVKSYKRIADIINYQLRIVKEYKAAFNRFKGEGQFRTSEIEYMSKVYKNLAEQSIKCLDELLMVITDDKLRMNDAERLTAIDKIYYEIVDQFSFLQEFNNSTAVLSVQRQKESGEIDISRKIHAIVK